MKKRKNQTLKITWIMTAVYWVVGILILFWGKIDHFIVYQLKEVNSFYTLVMLIILILPLLFSILLSMKVRPPRLICNPIFCLTYLLILIAAGIAYNLQSIIGYFFPFIFFIFMAILAIFYAVIKTFRNKKSSRYYYFNGKDQVECISFWDVFKKYYVKGLTYGIVEGLLTVINN